MCLLQEPVNLRSWVTSTYPSDTQPIGEGYTVHIVTMSPFRSWEYNMSNVEWGTCRTAKQLVNHVFTRFLDKLDTAEAQSARVYYSAPPASLHELGAIRRIQLDHTLPHGEHGFWLVVIDGPLSFTTSENAHAHDQ